MLKALFHSALAMLCINIVVVLIAAACDDSLEELYERIAKTNLFMAICFLAIIFASNITIKTIVETTK